MSQTTTKPAPTKKAIAMKVFKTLNRRKVRPSRKTFIEQMMEKADLSQKGAATYYQNITSGKWS